MDLYHNASKRKKKKTNKQTYQVVAVKRWWKHKLLLRHWQRYDKVTCHGGAGSIVPLHSLVVKLSFLFFPSLQITQIEFANF